MEPVYLKNKYTGSFNFTHTRYLLYIVVVLIIRHLVIF